LQGIFCEKQEFLQRGLGGFIPLVQADFRICSAGKSSVDNPEEKQVVFENTHGPILDAETWERVQELRKQRNARTDMTRLACFPAYCSVQIAEMSCTSNAIRQRNGNRIVISAEITKGVQRTALPCCGSLWKKSLSMKRQPLMGGCMEI